MAIELNVNKNDIKSPGLLEHIIDDLKGIGGVDRLVLKPTIKAVQWIEWFYGELQGYPKKIKSLFGRVRYGIGAIEFPEKIQKINNEIRHLKESVFNGDVYKSFDHLTKLFLGTVSAVDIVADAVEIGSDVGLYELNPWQNYLISSIGFAGSFSLFISSTKNINKYSDSFLNAEIGSHEFNFAFLKIVGSVCLLAISIFGMITFLYGKIVEKLILLSISTLVLLASTAAYFYEKMHIKKIEQ